MDHIDAILANEAEEPAVEQVTEQAAEPTPELVKAEEPAKPIEVEKTPEKPPEKYVPHGALHEERMRRKELAEELRKTQDKVGQFESLKEELMEIRRQKQAEAAALTAKRFEEDPVGAIKEQQDKIVNEIGQFKQQQEQQAKSTQEQQAQLARQNEIFNTTQTMAREYAQENADYPQALEYVMGAWAKQAQAMGYNNPRELDAVLMNQSMALAQHAISRGQNPAAVIHEMAKGWGFKVEAPKPSVTDAIDKLEKGQQAAKSNSSTTGQARGGELSLKDIEDMSDTDFDKLWSDMEKTARRR